MFKRSLESYSPLTHYVNHIGELNHAVVKAHREKDVSKIKELLSNCSKSDLDVFICVNNHWHAFLLLVPCGNDPLFPDMFSEDVFKIPGMLLCWRYELCFENEELMTYKLSNKIALFDDIKKAIKKSYYIGKYKAVPSSALDFAALRAAPQRYKHIVEDCVEYTKEFCICLLSYCSNGIELEKDVTRRIQDATATGLSVEVLSRRVKVSGFFGNISLSGVFNSSFLANRYGAICLILGILLFLIYPPLIAIIVVKMMK